MTSDSFPDLVAELPLDAGLAWHLKDNLDQDHPNVMASVDRQAVASAARGSQSRR